MAERVDFVGNKEELADFEVKFIGVFSSDWRYQMIYCWFFVGVLVAIGINRKIKLQLFHNRIQTAVKNSKSQM